MSNLPPINRLVTEDFPGQQKWIPRLIQPLNQFMTNVVFALNKSLTFTNNFNAQVRDIDVSGNLPFETVSFVSTIGKPAGIWVVNIQDKDSNSRSVVRSPITLDWEYRGNSVYIRNVSGLASIQLGDTTNSNANLTNVTNANELIVGQTISGTGIPTGTKIRSISGSTVTMDQNATATNAQQTLTFSGKSYKITIISVAG